MPSGSSVSGRMRSRAVRRATRRRARESSRRRPQALGLPGSQTEDYHDGLTFGMAATDANAGDTVSLSASGLPAGLSFTDNGDRTGTVSGTSITAAPGSYTATFTANDHHHLTTVT